MLESHAAARLFIRDSDVSSTGITSWRMTFQLGCATPRKMYISRIYIKNFRNFLELDLPVAAGVTCIVGENNTGKSNLVYALRLVLDGNISAYQRKLVETDFSAGIDPKTANHILIALEFSEFAADTNQEAMLHGCQSNEEGTLATVAFRFRPGRKARADIASKKLKPTELKIDDYEWEIRGGTNGKDLDSINWNTEFGSEFSLSHLQQCYLVVFLKALRDVEQELKYSRLSPLNQLLNDEDVSEAEKNELIQILQTANDGINDHDSIKKVGTDIEGTFLNTAGEAHSLKVRIGTVSPTFADLKRSLSVLLSNPAIKDFPPERNGLGLNNILYIAMVLQHFERRLNSGKTAGQLLLIEEPEAHLHPQLQRILMQTLKQKNVQAFVTSHSTHITSQQDLKNLLVLTNDGTSATSSINLVEQLPLEEKEKADIERYLDATRGALLLARKVLLVEGPSELFVIPPLVKQVMEIDLDSKGITVVPIYGKHFAPYAKLFGPDGITKKCAVLGDGDLAEDKPDDAEIEAEEEDLEKFENDFVKVFKCDRTFERELTNKGRLVMLINALEEVGSTGRAEKIRKVLTAVNDKKPVDWPAAQDVVLNAAKEVGKGRFGQVISKHVDKAKTIPPYIKDAIEWLIEE